MFRNGRRTAVARRAGQAHRAHRGRVRFSALLPLQRRLSTERWRPSAPSPSPSPTRPPRNAARRHKISTWQGLARRGTWSSRARRQLALACLFSQSSVATCGIAASRASAAPARSMGKERRIFFVTCVRQGLSSGQQHQFGSLAVRSPRRYINLFRKLADKRCQMRLTDTTAAAGSCLNPDEEDENKQMLMPILCP